MKLIEAIMICQRQQYCDALYLDSYDGRKCLGVGFFYSKPYTVEEVTVKAGVQKFTPSSHPEYDGDGGWSRTDHVLDLDPKSEVVGLSLGCEGIHTAVLVEFPADFPIEYIKQ